MYASRLRCGKLGRSIIKFDVLGSLYRCNRAERLPTHVIKCMCGQTVEASNSHMMFTNEHNSKYKFLIIYFVHPLINKIVYSRLLSSQNRNVHDWKRISSTRF